MMKDSYCLYLYSLATDKNQDVLGHILKFFLLLLSFVYGFLIKIILGCYRVKIFRRYTFEKKIISVGNITLGGVGKTPLVQVIARFLREQNLRPAILTRGYMGGPSPATRDECPLGDEPLLLKKMLPGIPVLVRPDRIASAREAIKNHGANILILDDGFQQWRIEKDLEIVVIDATNPFGNGHLLPRGILREPLSSLARGDIFVLTKTDRKTDGTALIEQKLRSLNPQALIAEAVHTPMHFLDLTNGSQRNDLSLVRGKNICSFCSIGDPESFEHTLRGIGCHVVKNFSFLDHHLYTIEDIRSIVYYCHEQKIKLVVTTQKDEVKLSKYINEFNPDLSLLSLAVEIKIVKFGDLFFDRIGKILAQ